MIKLTDISDYLVRASDILSDAADLVDDIIEDSDPVAEIVDPQIALISSFLSGYIENVVGRPCRDTPIMHVDVVNYFRTFMLPCPIVDAGAISRIDPTKPIKFQTRSYSVTVTNWHRMLGFFVVYVEPLTAQNPVKTFLYAYIDKYLTSGDFEIPINDVIEYHRSIGAISPNIEKVELPVAFSTEKYVVFANRRTARTIHISVGVPYEN